MKHANLVQPQHMLIEEVPVPQPGQGEARIAVEVCGVCGSDIHAYVGKHPFISCPIVPGHEFSGVVEALGEAPDGLRLGMRVIVEPGLTCGECEPCRSGRYNICERLRVIGCQATGAQAEFITVPAAKVIPIPDAMTFEQGALVEPTAVAVHALRRARIGEARRLLIGGAGTIGLQVLQVARALGVPEIIITDVIETRLDLSRRLGAAYAVNPREHSLADFFREKYGTERAVDLAMECVGAAATMKQCITSVKKGGQVVVVGVFGEEVPVPMGLVQDREIELLGTLMYVRADFEEARDLIAGGKVKTEPLITRRAALEELPEVMDAIIANPSANIKNLIFIRR
jgi:L-iditol 2-dehydrogenase